MFGLAGDGGPAWAATLVSPQVVVSDGAGGALILETLLPVLRQVFANGTIRTIAGRGTVGYSGDNGPATLAQLNNPTAALADGTGGFWFVTFWASTSRFDLR